ncbi:MAG: hypothetical protein HYV07_01875 [Deltaproteobacteria bacterium]|nr:hypothetical protein [Deltaproteobacteria bacterium]
MRCLPLALIACAPESPLRLEASPGEWLVVAVLDENGTLRRATLEVVGPEAHPVLIEHDAIAIGFMIDPASEVRGWAIGDALPRVVVGDPSNVGCGRCLLLAREPPLHALEGSVCSLPRWIRSSRPGYDALVDSIRPRIALSFGDTCASCKTLDDSTRELTAELVTSADDRPFGLGARLPGGGHAFVARQEVLWVSEDGTSKSTLLSGLRGQPRDVALFGDSVAIVTESALPSEVELAVVHPNHTGALDPEVLGGSIVGVTRLDERTIAVLGSGPDARPPPRILICRGEACAEIAPQNRRSEAAQDAIVTDSGMLVVSMNKLGVIVFDEVPDPTRVRSTSEEGVRLEDGTLIPMRSVRLPIEGAVLLGKSGARVLVCGNTDQDDALVYSFELNRGAEPVVELSTTVTGCQVFLPEVDGETALSTGYELVRFGANGAVKSRGLVSEVFPAVGALLGPAGELFSGDRGQLFDGDARGLERVRGAGSWRADAIAVQHRGRLWIVGADRRAELVGPSLVEHEGGFGEPIDDLASDGEKLLALTTTGILALDPDAGATRRIADGVFPASPRAHPGFAARIAALDPERAVVASASPFELTHVTNGSTRHLEVSWDDPMTTEPESAATPNVMTLLESAAGSTFLTATTYPSREGLVMRLVATPSGVRTERVAWGIGQPHGLAALCPDRALVSNRISGALSELAWLEPGLKTDRLVGHPWKLAGAGSVSYPVVTESSSFLLSRAPHAFWVSPLGGGPVVELQGPIRSYAGVKDTLLVLTSNGSVFRIVASGS